MLEKVHVMPTLLFSILTWNFVLFAFSAFKSENALEIKIDIQLLMLFWKSEFNDLPGGVKSKGVLEKVLSGESIWENSGLWIFL